MAPLKVQRMRSLKAFGTLVLATAGLTVLSTALPAAQQKDAGKKETPLVPPRKGKSEVIHLFNGKDFEGWEGHTDKYWSHKDGVIIGKNDEKNAPPVST